MKKIRKIFAQILAFIFLSFINNFVCAQTSLGSGGEIIFPFFANVEKFTCEFSSEGPTTASITPNSKQVGLRSNAGLSIKSIQITEASPVIAKISVLRCLRYVPKNGGEPELFGDCTGESSASTIPPEENTTYRQGGGITSDYNYSIKVTNTTTPQPGKESFISVKCTGG